MTIPAVAYYRMSNEKQETSIPAQRREVEAYAAKHGYKIVREYIDQGISGDATEKRVQFRKMIADSGLADFAVILCWDQDRFGRFDPLEAGYWIKPLRDAGIRLETMAQGRIDWEDFAGRIVYAVQQEAKHAYLRDLSRNVVRGMIQNARDGKWNGGPAPYGTRIENEHLVAGDPEKVKTLRWIFDACAFEALSLHEIALRLNEQGVPGPGGGLWYTNTVSRILRCPLYTGDGVWNRLHEGKYHGVENAEITPKKRRKTSVEHNHARHWITRPDTNEALIEQEVWNAVQQRLAGAKHRSTPHRNGGDFLLTGLVRCGHCGELMYNAKSKGMQKTYNQLLCSSYHRFRRQSGCDNYRIQERRLADVLIRRIQKDFLNPANLAKLDREIRRQLGVTAKGDPARTKALQKQLAEVEADIDRGSKRLLRLPDEMVPGVEKELQAAYGAKKRIAGELLAIQEASGIGTAEIDARAKQALAGLFSLQERFQSAKPAMMRQLFREVVSKVECRFVRVPYGKKGRMWSKLTEGFIHIRHDVAIARPVPIGGPIRIPARDTR